MHLIMATTELIISMHKKLWSAFLCSCSGAWRKTINNEFAWVENCLKVGSKHSRFHSYVNLGSAANLVSFRIWELQVTPARRRRQDGRAAPLQPSSRLARKYDLKIYRFAFNPINWKRNKATTEVLDFRKLTVPLFHSLKPIVTIQFSIDVPSSTWQVFWIFA